MNKNHKNDIDRIIPESPVYSRFEGTCKVCGKPYYKGEQISPFFDYNLNHWRHTSCYQLFYILFQFESQCRDCDKKIEIFERGYWSKHNGTWCVTCGEKMFPKTVVSQSRYQYEYFKNIERMRKNG